MLLIGHTYLQHGKLYGFWRHQAHVLPPFIGIAQIFSRVSPFLKGLVCAPKYGHTLNKPRSCKSQPCALLGVWDAAEELRGSDTRLWRHGLFSECKVTQKWNKTKQNPFSCTYSTGKPGLATSKIESLGRYLYTKTILVPLLTIIQFPDSHLSGELPLHICTVCYEPSVRGLLSCASLGQLLGDIMKTNKKSQSVARRSIAQGPSLLYEWFTWWISTWHLVTTLHVAVLIPCQDKANELMHVDLRLFKRCSWSNSRHLCLPSFPPPFWVYLFLVCSPNLEEQELSLLAGRWPAILEMWQV